MEEGGRSLGSRMLNHFIGLLVDMRTAANALEIRELDLLRCIHQPG